MAKRQAAFANITSIAVRALAGEIHRPDGVRRYAPKTFAARIDAEACVVA